MSDLPSWAVAGRKVVYVGGPSPMAGLILVAASLRVNETYTLRKVMLDQLTKVGACYVHEIINGLNRWGDEWGYPLSHFRPAVTLEDDIATHFEHHLHNDHRAPETVA